MKKAFTLAEVLITLMIIGIVAALTIPSVISNYQQQEFKTGLKKAVSVLNEAIQTNIAQEGENPYENADIFEYLQRHMSVLSSTIGGYNDGTSKNHAFYTTDGMRFEVLHWRNGGWPNLIFHESGIRLGGNCGGHQCYYGNGPHTSRDGNCGSYGIGENHNNTVHTPCLILVDVNGDRKPNSYAANVTATGDVNAGTYVVTKNYVYPSPSDKKIQDVFNILITEDKAIPFGVVAQRAMYSK